MEIDEDSENSLETNEDLISHLKEGDWLYGCDWDGYIARQICCTQMSSAKLRLST